MQNVSTVTRSARSGRPAGGVISVVRRKIPGFRVAAEAEEAQIFRCLILLDPVAAGEGNAIVLRKVFLKFWIVLCMATYIVSGKRCKRILPL